MTDSNWKEPNLPYSDGESPDGEEQYNFDESAPADQYHAEEEIPNQYGLYQREEKSREEELFSFRRKPEELQQTGAQSTEPVLLYSFRQTDGINPPLPPTQQPPKLDAPPSAILIFFGKLMESATGKRSPVLALSLLLGLPLAIILPIIAWNIFKPRPPFDDLGMAVFNASGLKGNLVAKWTAGKAEYRLRIEPNTIQQADGFSTVVGDPPQPISINIRLMDQTGFALCGKEVLFKFDPTKTAQPIPPPTSRNAAAIQAAKDQQAAQLATLQAQEQAREHGKDIFQNEPGADGKIVAITAQGDLPCSAKMYRNLDYWDFSTNFPLVAEQEELVKDLIHPAKAVAHTTSYGDYSGSKKSLPTAIEANDTITGSDLARGVVETSGGRVFAVDSGGVLGRAPGWQMFPVPIHYKCDKRAACILTRTGVSTVLHARLRR
jgi:hypothetical protein